QAGLSSSAVVGAFDPGDDRDAELFSGPPAIAVQDVLLKQREQGFHGGVVAGGPDLAHRSDEVMTVQSVHEAPRSKLGSAVRVHDATGDISSSGYRVVQGVHC